MEFRCWVGHTFSPKTILAQHFASQEKAVYQASVTLEEGASLAARLATHFDAAFRERLLNEAKERTSQARHGEVPREHEAFTLD